MDLKQRSSPNSNDFHCDCSLWNSPFSHEDEDVVNSGVQLVKTCSSTRERAVTESEPMKAWYDQFLAIGACLMGMLTLQSASKRQWFINLYNSVSDHAEFIMRSTLGNSDREWCEFMTHEIFALNFFLLNF